MADIITAANTYAMEEIQKGFQFPVTGKLRGRLIKAIIFYIPKEKRKDFLIETGRLVNFDIKRKDMEGHLGNKWCPANQDPGLLIGYGSGLGIKNYSAKT